MRNEKAVTIIATIFCILLSASAHAACGLKWDPVIVDETNNVQAVIDFDSIKAQQTSGVIFFNTKLCRVTESKKSFMPSQVKTELLTYEGNCKEFLGRTMQDIEINKNGQKSQKKVKEDFVNLYDENNMSRLFSEACKIAGMR